MMMPTHIVAVGGITENDKGQILLVKTHRGHWVFPGGQVENGENLTAALAREIKEESGIEVEVLNLIGISSNTSSHKGYNGVKHVPTKVMMDFTCRPLGGILSTSEETPESKWVCKDQVLDYIKSPNIVERYMAYINYSGHVTYLEYVTQPAYHLKLKRSF